MFMFYKSINKYLKEFSKRKNGQKRKFIVVGIINVILTNLTLQTLLLINFISIPISTLISQLVNMIFGYLMYSKFIFNVKYYRKKAFIAKYSLLMVFIWAFNSLAIELGYKYGISKNLTAFFIIPILAIISFVFQKFWVFK